MHLLTGLVLALLVGSGTPGAAAADPPARSPGVSSGGMAVRFSGELANQVAYTAPGNFLFDGVMRAADGAVVGSLTHRGRCSTQAPPPCLVLDVETIFRFPEGTVVSRATERATPDPGAPGVFDVGVDAAESRIVETTGAYAGRAGTTRMVGRDDCTGCPFFVVFDDSWEIVFTN